MNNQNNPQNSNNPDMLKPQNGIEANPNHTLGMQNAQAQPQPSQPMQNPQAQPQPSQPMQNPQAQPQPSQPMQNAQAQPQPQTIYVEKPVKKNGFFNLLGKALSVIFTIILLAYVGIVLYDYFQVRESKEPSFCLSSVVHTYDDGKTTEYNCLIYKVFKYERESLNAYEFGFFIKERNVNK